MTKPKHSDGMHHNHVHWKIRGFFQCTLGESACYPRIFSMYSLGAYHLRRCSRYLRRGVDGELQLGLLAVVHGQALHQQGREPRPGPTTKGVENQETLQAGTLLRLLPEQREHCSDCFLNKGNSAQTAS